MELSLVTHVPSGPIGCAWAGHFAGRNEVGISNRGKKMLHHAVYGDHPRVTSALVSDFTITTKCKNGEGHSKSFAYVMYKWYVKSSLKAFPSFAGKLLKHFPSEPEFMMCRKNLKCFRTSAACCFKYEEGKYHIDLSSCQDP